MKQTGYLKIDGQVRFASSFNKFFKLILLIVHNKKAVIAYISWYREYKGLLISHVMKANMKCVLEQSTSSLSGQQQPSPTFFCL